MNSSISRSNVLQGAGAALAGAAFSTRAHEPLRRQGVIDKFLLNAEHGGWSAVQSAAAFKLIAGLYNGCIDLSALRN
jgi:hypothetical protein